MKTGKSFFYNIGFSWLALIWFSLDFLILSPILVLVYLIDCKCERVYTEQHKDWQNVLVLVSKVIAGDTTASMLLVLKKCVWCLACLFPDVFRLILLLTDCHTVVVYYFTSINVHNASWISQLLSWYTMLWRKRGKMRMKRAWKRSQWREKKK